jgi:hypothetical protein
MNDDLDDFFADLDKHERARKAEADLAREEAQRKKDQADRDEALIRDGAAVEYDALKDAVQALAVKYASRAFTTGEGGVHLKGVASITFPPANVLAGLQKNLSLRISAHNGKSVTTENLRTINLELRASDQGLRWIHRSVPLSTPEAAKEIVKRLTLAVTELEKP